MTSAGLLLQEGMQKPLNPLKLGIRQIQVLSIMSRSGNRWPEGWKIPRGVDRQAMMTLVNRGLVDSMENPVLTRQGIKLLPTLFPQR